MKNMMLSAAAVLVLSSVSLPTLATDPTKDDCTISGSCDLIVKATVADQCSCSFEGYYPTLDIGKLNKYSSVYGKTSPYPQSMYISCNTKYGGNLSAVSANNGSLASFSDNRGFCTCQSISSWGSLQRIPASSSGW